MMSDVCKHCSAAPRATACPTGALIIYEFSTLRAKRYLQRMRLLRGVYPFGVIARSPIYGHARKCTLCYDRQHDDMTQRAPRRARPGRFSSDPSTYSKHVIKARGALKSTMLWLGTAFELGHSMGEQRPCLRSRQVPST